MEGKRVLPPPVGAHTLVGSLFQIDSVNRPPDPQTYHVAESLQDAKVRMRGFCEALSQPFHAQFHPATDGVWIDRAVRRHAAS